MVLWIILRVQMVISTNKYLLLLFVLCALLLTYCNWSHECCGVARANWPSFKKEKVSRLGWNLGRSSPYLTQTTLGNWKRSHCISMFIQIHQSWLTRKGNEAFTGCTFWHFNLRYELPWCNKLATCCCAFVANYSLGNFRFLSFQFAPFKTLSCCASKFQMDKMTNKGIRRWWFSFIIATFCFEFFAFIGDLNLLTWDEY